MQAHALLTNRPLLWLWSAFLLVALMLPPPGMAAADRSTVEGRAPSLLQVTQGKASFYGRKHNGTKTANGQRIDNTYFTAAHPTLPFGTIVRVTNLRNGRDVLVRINDRGPFVKGRIIDLSRAAAEVLNMMRSGVVDVQVEVLSDAKGKISQPENGFFLALREQVKPGQSAKALDAARTLFARHEKNPARRVQLIAESRSGKVVRHYAALGPYTSYASASALRKRLAKRDIATTIRFAPANFD